MGEVIDEVLTDDDAPENALLVPEQTHDRSRGEGDERVGAGRAPWRRGEIGVGSGGEAGLGAQTAGMLVGLGTRMSGSRVEEGEGGCAGDVDGARRVISMLVSCGRNRLVRHRGNGWWCLEGDASGDAV